VRDGRAPTALGLDETLFCRLGKFHRQHWSTSIVDVRAGVLLDVVPGRSGVEPCRWLAARPDGWRANICSKADERLDDHGRSKLLGLLAAGDPRGEVKTAWHAKEVVRSIYEHRDPALADAFDERLGHDLQDDGCPIEVRSLGRTLLRWKDQIAAWHRAPVSNGPTEAANNLIKRVKRVAFGFTLFDDDPAAHAVREMAGKVAREEDAARLIEPVERQAGVVGTDRNLARYRWVGRMVPSLVQRVHRGRPDDEFMVDRVLVLDHELHGRPRFHM
jgi:hypothetical protein